MEVVFEENIIDRIKFFLNEFCGILIVLFFYLLKIRLMGWWYFYVEKTIGKLVVIRIRFYGYWDVI